MSIPGVGESHIGKTKTERSVGVQTDREMYKITSKFRDKSQMHFLPGGPRQSHKEESLCQRVVISEQSELPPLQKKMEMSH